MRKIQKSQKFTSTTEQNYEGKKTSYKNINKHTTPWHAT